MRVGEEVSGTHQVIAIGLVVAFDPSARKSLRHTNAILDFARAQAPAPELLQAIQGLGFEAREIGQLHRGDEEEKNVSCCRFVALSKVELTLCS